MPIRQTTQFTPPPSSILAAAKSKDRPVGGAPAVRIPPLDAEALEGGGSMAQQARVLADPTSPLSPAYDPALAQAAASRARPVRPPQGTPDGPYRPQLSPETKESLEVVRKFQAEAEAAQREAVDKEVEEAPDPAKAGDAAIDELRTLFADDAQWSILNNPERRKVIEARLQPLDIADILIHGEVRQEIPIVVGKLTIMVRSVNGEEDLAVKQLMGTESGTDRYLMDKFSLMGVTLGLVSINGAELPVHLNKDGDFDKALFMAKFKKVLRYPLTMLSDFGLQFFWFEKRVQALFADHTTALKNS